MTNATRIEAEDMEATAATVQDIREESSDIDHLAPLTSHQQWNLAKRLQTTEHTRRCDCGVTFPFTPGKFECPACESAIISLIEDLEGDTAAA
jgi:hypothetical protein